MNKPKFELGQTVYLSVSETEILGLKILGVQVYQDSFAYNLESGNRSVPENRLYASKNEAIDVSINYYKGLIKELEAQKEE